MAMAACTGAEHATSSGGGEAGHIAGAGGLGATGQGGAGHGGAGGKDAGIWDVLTDPVPEASADPVSGSRLKATYRIADDGAKAYLPYIWYDSARGEDCAFALAADGKERCLPNHYVFATYYQDPACTQLLATASPQTAACLPKYAASIDDVACPGSATHIYSAGASVNPPKIYGKSGNMCFDEGAPIPTLTYYQVGAEIPPSSFVAGAVQHDP